MSLSISSTDAFLILAYLLGVVLFGLWIGRRKGDLTDYLLGGRDLPWWAVLGSIVATETSTATFLSVPAIAYAVGGNLTFLQLTFGYILGRWLIVLLFLPQLWRGHVFSAYELLQQRFGNRTRTVACLMFLVTRNFGDGLRLFLTAMALQVVTGLSLSVSVVVIGCGTIVYTLIGGIRSVVWNDCVQFVVYTVGGIIGLAVIVEKLPGGWDQLWQFAATHDKLQFLDTSLDWKKPFTLWSGVIGGTFLALGTHGTDQMMVQRYLCARSQRDAGRALIASGIVVLLQFALFLILGVALACFYQNPPRNPFSSGDQVFASFIVDHMPVGVVGLLLAAVFAAAMSTLSSSLNSSATATLSDLVRPRLPEDISDQSLVNLSRLLTACFGVVQIAVAIWAQQWSDNVVTGVLTIAGFTAGILLGVFLLALSPWRVGEPGVLCGIVCGLSVVSYAKFGTEIPWTWFALIGAITTVGMGWLISLFWSGGNGRE
ncbi:MAG: sodium:solute symporter [Planctomycetaceae bacterium]